MRTMKALSLAIALVFGSAVMAADDVAVRQLVDQAQYWEKKGDDERAAQAWQKLLRADPLNATAQAGMARLNARRGGVLQPLVDDVPGARDRAASAAPRAATPPSRSPEGTATRPQAYAGLTGSTEGWAAARASLEVLARQNPDDAAVRFELAKVLTYREGTRPEGLRMLQALAQAKPDDAAIRDAWRQALTWLGNRASDRALIEAYLAKHPGDQSLRERLRAPATGARGSATSLSRLAGFAALDRGDHEKAEAAFRAALQSRPNDAEALGGLGVIFLRREDFPEAARLLDRAVAAGGGQWRDAARSARYWRDVEAARAARLAGRRDEAARLAQAAARADASEPEAAVLLADIQAERGQAALAERAYRAVLARHPTHEGAFRGLLAILANTGRIAEMQTLVAEMQGKAGGDGASGQARAVLMLRESEVLAAAGDDAGAAALLEDALVRDPGSQPIRVALARVYQRLGRAQAAVGLLGSALDADAQWQDGWFAKAQALAAQKRWLEALFAMENIPFGERDDAMAAEQNRFWVNARAERAVALAGDGQAGEGLTLLMEAERRAEGNPGAMAAVASAWVDLGQPARGIAMARRLVSASPTPDIGLQTTYAGLLLRAGETDEAALILEHLSGQSLSDGQINDLNALIRAYTLRQADILREEGRYAEAFDVLRPLMQQGPDTALTMALARLYLSAGDREEAQALAESVLKAEPRSLEHRLFVAGMSISARDWPAAERHLAVASQISPGHPRVLTMQGRLAKARGDRAGATALFEQALAAEGTRAGITPGGGLMSLRLVESEGSVGWPGGGRAAPSPSIPARPRLLPMPGQAAPVGTLPPSSRGLSLPRATSDATRRTASPLRRAAAVASRETRLPSLPRSTAAASSDPATEAERELAQLEAERSPKVEAGIDIGGRSGETGLGQLDHTALTVQGHWPTTWGGTLSASLTAVDIDAGPFDTRDIFASPRFGTNALGAFLAAPPPAPLTTDSGLAAAFAYRDETLAFDAGVTPVGFVLGRAVGGLSLFSDAGDWRLQGTVERRAVTDSLLSWGGILDPQSLRRWGAVTRNGARFSAASGNEQTGVYGALGMYQLEGRLVARNNATELGVGAYMRLWDDGASSATLGVHFETQAYEKNLSRFTFGHGGYFSPQRFVSLSFPFTASGQRGDLSYQWGAEVGVRNIRQDSAPFFPNDPALQFEWERRLSTPGLGAFSARHPGSNERGFGYGMHGAFEYRVMSDLSVGGRFFWDDSRDFSRYGGLLYLRYGLQGLPLPAAPPRPLQPIEKGVP